MPKPKIQPSVLAEAEAIINGPRRDAYGDAKASFERIAAGWSALLQVKLTKPLTAREVSLMMVVFKAHRDANKPQRDNIVDIAGYAGLADKL